MYKITKSLIHWYNKKGKIVATYYKRNSGKYIKDKCFLCGNKIPGTWKYYCIHGNCCSVCNARLEKKIKRKKSFVNQLKPLLTQMGIDIRTRKLKDKQLKRKK